MPQLSIVIPTKNSPASLQELLTSLSSQVNAHALEVFVVHNLMDTFFESKYSMFKNSFESFNYICSDQPGVNTARNYGLALVSSPIVWFLDDDCYLQKNNLAELIIERHASFPHVAGIGGAYLLPDEKTSIFTRVYHSIAEHWLINSIDTHGNQTCLIGGNASYKVKDIAHNFDEYIIFGGSEISFNWKFILGNKSLALSRELDVIHKSQLNLFVFISKAFAQGRGHAHNLKFIFGNESENAKKLNIVEFNNSKERWVHEVYKYFFFLGIYDKKKKNNNRDFFITSILETFFQATLKKTFQRMSVKYYWLIMKPLYNFSSHLWKVKKPYYFLAKNGWKIKKVYYFFAVNGWKIKLPFYKIYYVAKYHVNTYLLLGFLRNNSKDKR